MSSDYHWTPVGLLSTGGVSSPALWMARLFPAHPCSSLLCSSSLPPGTALFSRNCCAINWKSSRANPPQHQFPALAFPTAPQQCVPSSQNRRQVFREKGFFFLKYSTRASGPGSKDSCWCSLHTMSLQVRARYYTCLSSTLPNPLLLLLTTLQPVWPRSTIKNFSVLCVTSLTLSHPGTHSYK